MLGMSSPTHRKVFHYNIAFIIVIASEMLRLMNAEIVSNSLLHSQFLVHHEYCRREVGRVDESMNSKEKGLGSLGVNKGPSTASFLLKVRTSD